LAQPYIQLKDIWLVNRPEAVGTVQFASHPSLVVGHCPEAKQITIIPLTSKFTARRFPYTYDIPCSVANGLNQDSVALVFQTMCVPYEYILGDNKIGRLEQNIYFQVCTILKKYLGL
jgi:mRNA-degrading endonuclease toxin of MazEF toxin-antitoxin module